MFRQFLISLIILGSYSLPVSPVHAQESKLAPKTSRFVRLVKTHEIKTLRLQVVRTERPEQDAELFTRVARMLVRSGIRVTRDSTSGAVVTAVAGGVNQDGAILSRLKVSDEQGRHLATFRASIGPQPPLENKKENKDTTAPQQIEDAVAAADRTN